MHQSKRYICLFLTLVVFFSLLAVPSMAAGNIVYGIGFVKATALYLRTAPSADSKVLDVALKNECVVVLDMAGDWYYVDYNLQKSYMHSDHLNVLTKENAELGYGVVTGSRVNLRSGPGTHYKVTGNAKIRDKLYIIGINEGWYKVLIGSSACYIRSDYLKLTEIPYENQDSLNAPKYFRFGKPISSTPSSSAPAVNNNVDFSGSQIVSEAQKYLGIPYVYGGASPSGFDCSGLVYYVLSCLGYSPNRTPEAQYTHGTYVSKNELLPGDIVFFSSNNRTITHVGIYAGNGQFIHSPNSRSTVSYADLSSGYWSTVYYGARRIA